MIRSIAGLLCTAVLSVWAFTAETFETGQDMTASTLAEAANAGLDLQLALAMYLKGIVNGQEVLASLNAPSDQLEQIIAGQKTPPLLRICPYPHVSSAADLVSVVQAYMKERPLTLHLPAGLVAFKALEERYPCH